MAKQPWQVTTRTLARLECGDGEEGARLLRHFETYPSKVRSLSLRQIQDAARKTIHLDKVVWVVVGDRAKIEPGIRELGFCKIKVIDGNGNEVQD